MPYCQNHANNAEVANFLVRYPMSPVWLLFTLMVTAWNCKSCVWNILLSWKLVMEVFYWGTCDTFNMKYLSWQIKFPFLSWTNCDHGNSSLHTTEESCTSDGKTMSQKGSCLTEQEWRHWVINWKKMVESDWAHPWTRLKQWLQSSIDLETKWKETKGKTKTYIE